MMTTITKDFTFSAGASIIASEHNSNFNTIYNDYNGSITNANIDGSAAIANAKLNLASIAQNITFTGNNTFAGTTIADLGSVTTADTNGGTLDGVQIGGTTATGELIVNDSSDAANGLGDQGTSGQRLTSAGVGSNPTWETVISPGLTLLSTTTNTGQTNTGDITIAANKTYLVDIKLEVDSSSASDIEIRINSTGGTSYAFHRSIVDSTSTSTAIDSASASAGIGLGSMTGNTGFIKATIKINTSNIGTSDVSFIGSGVGVFSSDGIVNQGWDVWGNSSVASPTSFEIVGTNTFDFTVRVYELSQ